MGWLTRIIGEPGPKMVCVAVAPNEAMSDLLVSLLHDAQIPAITRGSAARDIPGVLAGRPRDILVPEHFELDARAVTQPALDEVAGD